MAFLDDKLRTTDRHVADDGADPARQRAIKQIERRHHFHLEAASSAIGMLVLVVIWATS